MPFEMVEKGKFSGHAVMTGTVAVEPVGNGRALRFIVAADIAARYPDALFADVFVGTGADAGSVRIAPCGRAGENSYKFSRTRTGHLRFSIAASRLGIPLDHMPCGVFYPAFTACGAHITVNLDTLTLRRASSQVRNRRRVQAKRLGNNGGHDGETPKSEGRSA